jgi:hypothetical protein
MCWGYSPLPGRQPIDMPPKQCLLVINLNLIIVGPKINRSEPIIEKIDIIDSK